MKPTEAQIENRKEELTDPSYKKVSRRELIERIGKSTIGAGFASLPASSAPVGRQRVATQLETPPPPSQLPGTEPLTREGDLAKQMVAGIHTFLLEQTKASVDKREALWGRVYSSHALYEKSVEPNRKRFAKAIGLIDERVPYAAPEIEVSFGQSIPAAIGDGYKIHQVRWPVLKGVDGAGLLLQPEREPVASVVALGDADWSPEMLVGLDSGVPAQAQYARRLAENGCLVLIPTLINRQDTWSGNNRIGKVTNLTHREYIYRMAYEVGRHIIGYEVQKVLAAVDWFAHSYSSRPIGLIGYGEGGLLALYSAALDTRIGITTVSGYFQPRQELWEEPLYRNIWTLLYEFGDAELATLIAPRTLIVEASPGPNIPGPPPAGKNVANCAATGRLVSPSFTEVSAEVERARPVFEKLGVATRLLLMPGGGNEGNPGSDKTLGKFLEQFGAGRKFRDSGHAPRYQTAPSDPTARLYRQFEQLVTFTQHSVIESEGVRKSFWSKADDSSIPKWRKSTEFYRRYLWEEIFGKLPSAPSGLAAQSRKIYDEVGWTGYEVFLPLWPDVFAYGILLLPRAMEPREQRPVVVCQHGLEGRPQDLIKPDRVGDHYYHRFAADLADHGFVVYCPQNPYIGGDAFRKLQRLANPLKLSLFSFILSQHERTLDWLVEQSFVDPDRIGFYGLSYGGKTAIRVPPLLERYALSICSGDFNEWIWKVSRDDAPFTYVFTPEYEVPEFDLGNTFNHSDMAKLMTPRPFMVERGHDDGVSIDSWVAYEYAKVRYHYDLLGLYDRAAIDYFNGPHTIHGVQSFQFLHRFLNWGEPFHW